MVEAPCDSSRHPASQGPAPRRWAPPVRHAAVSSPQHSGTVHRLDQGVPPRGHALRKNGGEFHSHDSDRFHRALPAHSVFRRSLARPRVLVRAQHINTAMQPCVLSHTTAGGPSMSPCSSLFRGDVGPFSLQLVTDFRVDRSSRIDGRGPRRREVLPQIVGVRL